MINKLKECTGFEWDKFNLTKSRDKHNVKFTECEELFFNEPLLVSYDEKHSIKEDRYFALGKTNNERLLFTVFTIRDKKIRIISSRDMNKYERKIYDEKAKENT